MNFKKQLAILIESRVMTAAELSRRAKVPKQSISGWLSGSKPRDFEQVKRVADVLGVSLEELLFHSGVPNKKADTSELEKLVLGDDWYSGVFEIRVRRIHK